MGDITVLTRRIPQGSAFVPQLMAIEGDHLEAEVVGWLPVQVLSSGESMKKLMTTICFPFPIPLFSYVIVRNNGDGTYAISRGFPKLFGMGKMTPLRLCEHHVETNVHRVVHVVEYCYDRPPAFI